MASNNMYRVGDFVYFEASASSPYQIRRIDELTKTATGAVEAKVACYFRRRDVSNALIQQAQKYYCIDEYDSDSEEDEAEAIPDAKGDREDKRAVNEAAEDDDDDESTPSKLTIVDGQNGAPEENGSATPKKAPAASPAKPAARRTRRTPLTTIQKHQIRHHELFLSRQVETLPATHIRGKCSVTLFNDVEPLTNYLNREDAFYYKLIYDPTQKTLQEDRGALRIGTEYQCSVQPLLKNKSEDVRMKQELEQLVWSPSLNRLSEADLELFHMLAKSVGTYARAHDPSMALRQGPFLLDAAASAGRDVTRQYAHDLLHRAGYDLTAAIRLLVPGGQPLLCRDQLEDWSPSEAAIFEEALEKYSKVFTDIQADFLSWKTQQAIVEMYYFWKTTDRYVKKRRSKMASQEHKLKQVYIPNYNKPNNSVLYHNVAPSRGGSQAEPKQCECCQTSSSPQWYAWGSANLLCKLCASCWTYWKKFGGLKSPDAHNKANMPSDRELRAQERLEAANSHGNAGARIALNTSSMPNGNLSINMSGKNALQHQQQQQQQEKQQGGEVSVHGLVMGSNGTVRGGTLLQVTPAFLRLSRMQNAQLLRPRKMARRPGRAAWLSATGGQEAAACKEYDALILALREKAQPLLAQRDRADRLLQHRAPPTDQQERIVRQMARLLRLKGISVPAEANGGEAQAKKRAATDESAKEAPSAKKQMTETTVS